MSETRLRGTPRLLVVLAAISGLGAISIDMYLPALPSIAERLSAEPAQVQLTLGAFFIAYGVGQLLYGPLSDRTGRRPVMVGGVVLYIVGSAACALASGVGMLIAARVLQALGASAGVVVARAAVRDLYEGDAAARAMSMLISVFAVVPLVAPVVGGYVLVWSGWRAIFWVLLGFGALCLVAVVAAVPESLPRSMRARGGIGATLGTYVEILRHRRALGSLIAGGAVFGGMFAYISGTPFVYIDLFGVAPQHYGFLFGINVLGIIASSQANARLVMRHGSDRLLRIGVHSAAGAGVALAVVTTADVGGLPAIVVCLFFFVGMIGFVGANAVAGALRDFPRAAGAAAALFGGLQFGIGALAASLVGTLHDGTARPMGWIIAATGLIALVAYRRLARA
ncbi:MAG: Bcr/CflA family multidrug efflux MFS transporter [Ectothiorhodospiraceae bacterium]|nr:Bcr/CflA family multidrug efflux MFS transporter [Chromatiales bacterium]MCP5154514.1 Bcr/CflA family multidrug efflux MFS transporter [Ectothiorhodospiraceae bacterium]